MYKILLLLALSAVMLTGCERQQQNVNSVFNKETSADFTTNPPPKKMPPPPPMLPGKAQVIGAPVYDFATQTGRSQVAPKADLKKPQAQ